MILAMRARKLKFAVGALVIILIIYLLIHDFRIEKEKSQAIMDRRDEVSLTIVVVACGQRFHETLVMVKSALIFSPSLNLSFIIFCDDKLFVQFSEKLDEWQNVYEGSWRYELRKISFPTENALEWRNLFKPCAAQRLFLPSLLKSVDSVLYVDTDVIFLSPVSKTWSFFEKFNSSQIAALAPEHEEENIGWYNRFARHPFFGRTGLNSGVMLMNLTRMRDFDWERKVLPLYKEYKLKITWGDQDLINILFYFYPDKMYLMPCSFNYRPDHCMYSNVCNVSSGINVIHGNRGYFHSMKQPFFRAIFNSVENYQLGTSTYYNFYLPLKATLENPSTSEGNCGTMSEHVTNQLKRILARNDQN